MGASYILYALPHVRDMSPARIEQLGQLIKSIPDDVIDKRLEEDPSYFSDSDPVEVRTQLAVDVESYLQLEDCGRGYAFMQLPGCNLPYYFTGGPSWGDAPSDESEFFDRLGSFDCVFNQLRVWAEEDHLGQCPAY